MNEHRQKGRMSNRKEGKKVEDRQTKRRVEQTGRKEGGKERL